MTFPMKNRIPEFHLASSFFRWVSVEGKAGHELNFTKGQQSGMQMNETDGESDG